MLAYPSFWRLAHKPSSSKPIRVPGLGPAHLLVRTGDEHFAPVLRGLRYRGDIGIVQKKMETTIACWGYIGIMEKKMETTF